MKCQTAHDFGEWFFDTTGIFTAQPFHDPPERTIEIKPTPTPNATKDASPVSWGKANIIQDILWPSLGLTVKWYFPFAFLNGGDSQWWRQGMKGCWQITLFPAVHLWFGGVDPSWFERPVFFRWFFQWNQLPTCTTTSRATATFFNADILLMICWLDLDSNLEGTYIYIIKSACIAKTLQTALLPSNEDGPVAVSRLI